MHQYGEILPFMPSIAAAQQLNVSECVCSDLQHEDYSVSYEWFNYVLIIVALPTLSVFGVATNIVNVFIYSRKRMQNSANTYLLFLACSDFLVIITGLFIFWIDSARSYIPELARAPYTTVYTLPFGYMAQTCSIYFTVAAAVDCYINVCWKSVSARHCTVRRAKQINTCITVCSIVYNSLRFPQFNLRKCLHESSQEIIIEICPTSLFFTINTIYNVYMYMVLMTLLPFLFLLILNAIIVVQQSSNAQGKKSISTIASLNSMPTLEGKISPADDTGSTRTSTYAIVGSAKKQAMSKQLSPGNDSADDTITMIMVVVLFLCCNTLALVVNVIETFFDPDTLLLNFLTDGSNFLVIFNSSVNCLIYLIFNAEYREVFVLHAARMRKYVVDECCKCGAQRVDGTGNQQRLIFKPAATNGNAAATMQRPTALLRRVSDKRDLVEHESTNMSPVWQPLRSHGGTCDNWPREYRFEMPGGSTLSTNLSPVASYDPSNGTALLADDECDCDSRWDDSVGNQASVRENAVRPRSWIAEVKIVDGLQGSSTQPHILANPLRGCDGRRYNSTTI
uniref:G-protein coupled receptors family 1 profile domain-containing protein n=1 Tax=Parascaris univalens TaxID=6257 RepID=A0A915B564_PARUN